MYRHGHMPSVMDIRTAARRGRGIRETNSDTLASRRACFSPKYSASETAAPRMQSLVRKSAMLHANYTKMSAAAGGVVYFTSAATSIQRARAESSRSEMRRV